MLPKSFRKLLCIGVLALCATFSYSPSANAQVTGEGDSTANATTWPTSLTLGFGAAANLNWNATSGYNPGAVLPGGSLYTASPATVRPEIHILAEIPIAKNFMFAPRIAYNNYSLQWNQPSGTVGNGLKVSTSEIGADLLLKYAFNNLHVLGGLNLATPISQMQFKQTVAGVDQTSDINNNATFLAALKLGVGYDIPINSKNTMWITPEAFYTLGLTTYHEVTTDNSFTPSTISIGASLKFAINSSSVPPPPPIDIKPTITARGIMPDGSFVSEPVSPESSTLTRASLPLLPYVFFGNNSAAIPSRYNRAGSTGFDATSALEKGNAIDANHDVLDIIGQRLKDNPDWKVTLTGCNSNSGMERRNVALSRARATAVADYLHNTWGIADSRMTIEARDLPRFATNPVTGAGIEENRRVEISSNNSELTAPVKLESRESANVGPTQIRFDMSTDPSVPANKISNWSVQVDKDGLLLASPVTGTGVPPASTTVTINNASQYLKQPIHYTMTVTDVDGRSAKADGYTRIVPQTVTRDNLEHYAMLSFDFDRSDINPRAKQMLQLISESISRDANGLLVDGYCDSTGSAEYNQQLSNARATSAVTVLRTLTSVPANVQARGHGKNDPKFVNDLPEGRQLNRRVEITIEKSSH